MSVQRLSVSAVGALALSIAACGGPRIDESLLENPAPQVVRVPTEASAATGTPAEVEAAEVRRRLMAMAAAEPAARAREQHALLPYADAALPTFVESLGDSALGPVARQAAAWVLGESNDARACAALSEAWLTTAGQPEGLRVAVAVASGRCGDPAPLLGLVEFGNEERIRLKAAVTLGVLDHGDAAFAIAVLRDEVQEALRDYATLALAMLGDTTAGQVLVASMPNGLPGAPDIAGVFALALARSGHAPAEVQQALRDASTGHSDPLVREAALEVLVNQRDAFATTKLTTALSDPSPRVAARARAWLDAWERP